MKLNISKENCNYYGAISKIKERLNIQYGPDGMDLILESWNDFEVHGTSQSLIIKYSDPIQIFRGLSLAVQQFKYHKVFSHKEHVAFKTSGIMLDMSQNGVMKLEAIKSYIEMMALMGHNRLYLYLEDLYEVEGLPYFAYMRGAYTRDELREIDAYAGEFAIETIPVIQTLGHLSRVLQWDAFKEIRDTNDILLVGEQASYDFLFKLISSISACFATNKIHLGMDESTRLGLGEYRVRNGDKSSSDLMMAHLKEVIQMTDKLGLEAMIWSDMFFRLCSDQHDYYDLDAQVSPDICGEIPDNLKLVYWDYYHHEDTFYDQMIQKHQELTDKLVFATGIWTWNSTATNYRKTFETMPRGLVSCRRNGVQEVMTTIWGDDGTEVNYFGALLGVQLAAEHAYNCHVSDDMLKERFKVCTGGSYDLFMLMSGFDDTPCTDYDHGIDPVYNPSKYCLWQDPLIGLFDNNINESGIGDHYHELHTAYTTCKEEDDWSELHQYYVQLSKLLGLKSELGIAIKSAYDQGNHDLLQQIADYRIRELISHLQMLHEQHRHLWHKTYKAFGWEVLDRRYGGLLARLKSTRKRLKGLTSGKVKRLEELEVERLPYGAGFYFNNQKMMTVKNYEKCVTPGQLNHNPEG